jgi:hypothetical protein
MIWKILFIVFAGIVMFFAWPAELVDLALQGREGMPPEVIDGIGTAFNILWLIFIFIAGWVSALRKEKK